MCRQDSTNWPAIVLQCDISTHTIIKVSDRIADNRDGQFEFEPSKMDAVITEQGSAAKRSVDRYISRLCCLFALADCKRSSMKKSQFTISMLLLATLLVAVASWTGMKFRDWHTVIDFTHNRSDVCEVHGTKMERRLVGMSHGMPNFYPDGDPEVDARRCSFPHADEPYRTGYCCPTVQTKARTYVCSKCSLARDAWTKASAGP